jgi:hypothetical protein
MRSWGHSRKESGLQPFPESRKHMCCTSTSEGRSVMYNTSKAQSGCLPLCLGTHVPTSQVGTAHPRASCVQKSTHRGEF